MEVSETTLCSSLGKVKPALGKVKLLSWVAFWNRSELGGGRCVSPLLFESLQKKWRNIGVVVPRPLGPLSSPNWL